eukprot:gene26530-32061_t
MKMKNTHSDRAENVTDAAKEVSDRVELQRNTVSSSKSGRKLEDIRMPKKDDLKVLLLGGLKQTYLDEVIALPSVQKTHIRLLESRTRDFSIDKDYQMRHSEAIRHAMITLAMLKWHKLFQALYLNPKTLDYFLDICRLFAPADLELSMSPEVQRRLSIETTSTGIRRVLQTDFSDIPLIIAHVLALHDPSRQVEGVFCEDYLSKLHEYFRDRRIRQASIICERIFHFNLPACTVGRGKKTDGKQALSASSHAVDDGEESDSTKQEPDLGDSHSAKKRRLEDDSANCNGTKSSNSATGHGNQVTSKNQTSSSGGGKAVGSQPVEAPAAGSSRVVSSSSRALGKNEQMTGIPSHSTQPLATTLPNKGIISAERKAHEGVQSNPMKEAPRPFMQRARGESHASDEDASSDSTGWPIFNEKIYQTESHYASLFLLKTPLEAAHYLYGECLACIDSIAHVDADKRQRAKNKLSEKVKFNNQHSEVDDQTQRRLWKHFLKIFAKRDSALSSSEQAL